MSLNYGPLRGEVAGSNKAKRVLVRSLTGIGTMAAYLVGGQGGFGGLNGQLNNSVLLRERIASNAGLAGEQEMARMHSASRPFPIPCAPSENRRRGSTAR